MTADREPTMTPQRIRQWMELCELAADLCSPEGYGLAVPPEVVKRAARILKMAPVKETGVKI